MRSCEPETCDQAEELNVQNYVTLRGRTMILIRGAAFLLLGIRKVYIVIDGWARIAKPDWMEMLSYLNRCSRCFWTKMAESISSDLRCFSRPEIPISKTRDR